MATKIQHSGYFIPYLNKREDGYFDVQICRVTLHDRYMLGSDYTTGCTLGEALDFVREKRELLESWPEWLVHFETMVCNGTPPQRFRKDIFRYYGPLPKELSGHENEAHAFN
jgi:hypothetical protein